VLQFDIHVVVTCTPWHLTLAAVALLTAGPVRSFTPSYTSITAWDKERLLLKRELGQRQ
jgi:hypothetical protein